MTKSEVGDFRVELVILLMIYGNLDASTGVSGAQLSWEKESQAMRYQSNGLKKKAKNARVKFLTAYRSNVRG